MSELKQLTSGLKTRKQIKGSATQQPETSNTQVDRRSGRPKTGKRSDPAYKQVTAWVRKDTHDLVTKRLFLEESRREFSDLIQVLLEDWLKAGEKARSR